VCKTVAKLLAGHSCRTPEIRRPQDSAELNGRGAFFPHSIRQARNDTREKSRIRISSSLPSCTSPYRGQANITDWRVSGELIRMEQNDEPSAASERRGEARRAINQIAPSRSSSPFAATKEDTSDRFERGKKVSLNRPLMPEMPFPPCIPSFLRSFVSSFLRSFVGQDGRKASGGVISGAVKLSFGYQRDATPRARIRAREVIWLSETQTLLCPKVVEYNGLTNAPIHTHVPRNSPQLLLLKA
jgi:hypothetical protein